MTGLTAKIGMGLSCLKQPSLSKPPPHLGEDGKALWESVVKKLEQAGYATGMDFSGLEMLCETEDLYKQAHRQAIETPAVSFTEKGESVAAIWKIRNSLAAMKLSIQRQFGLTINSRSNLRPVEVKDNKTKQQEADAFGSSDG